MTDKPVFFFLTNANTKIGAGHLRRCLSIAEVLENKLGNKTSIGFIHWALDAQFDQELKNYLSLSTEKGQLIPFLSKLETGENTPVLVVDTDDADVHSETFQQQLRSIGWKSAYFSVNSTYPYYCDLLINPSILALHQDYRTSDETQFLFGPEVFIFNKKFRRLKPKTLSGELHTVFINFGNADPQNYTLKVLQALSADSRNHIFEYKIVMGKLSQEVQQVKDFVAKSELKGQIFHDANNMAEIMSDCQLAICSPGTTFWELTLLGIKSIVLSSSSREIESAQLLHDQEYATLLTHCGTVFDEQVELKLNQLVQDFGQVGRRINNLQKLINPNGVKRITEELLQLSRSEND